MLEMGYRKRCRARIATALSAVFFCACGGASSSGQPTQVSSGAAVAAGGAGAAGMTGGGAPVAGTGGMQASSGGAVNAGGASAGAARMVSSGGMAASSGATIVYVGSTNGQIALYTLDPALGKLGLIKSVSAGNYPSFLALDPARAHLYAVNEPDAMVASFAVDPNTGDLTFLNRVASGGASPAFVSVDHSGKYVMVANYDGGTTRVFPIGADGSLGAPSDDKAPGKWSHMILADAANKFVFVMNKGSDLISQYVFDAEHGTLTPNAVPTVMTAAGAGPRHLAFHPNGEFAYVIDELDDTMSAYSYDATLGQLQWLQTLSTLPPGTDGTNNTCAEVMVAPSGSFVYGSNRGNDSIVTYSVDAGTGMLTYIGVTPSGGNTPRSFTLSADGKLMLVANESGNVVSFSVNVTSGALTKLLTVDVPTAPQFVGIVSLPGGAAR
jgi:6-phosphogluconolactonase